MKRDTLCGIKIAEKEIEVRYLGKGRFSTVYRDENVPHRVYIRTKDGDDGKRVLSKCEPSIHIPRLKWLAAGTAPNGLGFTWYESDYLDNLTAASRIAWDQAVLLKKILQGVKQAQFAPGLPSHVFAYQVRNDFWDHLEDHSEQLPKSLVDAIKEIGSWMTNFSDTAMFEFNKPNLGVSGEGHLMLRDVVFSHPD